MCSELNLRSYPDRLPEPTVVFWSLTPQCLLTFSSDTVTSPRGLTLSLFNLRVSQSPRLPCLPPVGFSASLPAFFSHGCDPLPGLFTLSQGPRKPLISPPIPVLLGGSLSLGILLMTTGFLSQGLPTV